MTRQEKVELWLSKHPDDEPCPISPDSARAWRIERGLEKVHYKARAKWKRYPAAMAERRACEAGAKPEPATDAEASM